MGSLGQKPFGLQDDGIRGEGAAEGLMPRLLAEAFGELARRQREADGSFYRCTCSYLQIHNEQITDLLFMRLYFTRVWTDPIQLPLQIEKDFSFLVFAKHWSIVLVKQNDFLQHTRFVFSANSVADVS